MLVVCLGIACGIIFVGCGEHQDETKPEATAIVEFSVNPEVQVVLDQDDNVMNVNYLSDETQMIFSRTNFIGISAGEMGSFFARVVSNCGKVDLSKGFDESTDGTTVSIKIYCEDDEKFEKLRGEIALAINKYFRACGIVAGAVTTRMDNLMESISKLDATVDTTSLTNEEIFNLLAKKSNQIKGVHFSQWGNTFAGIENVKTEFGTYITNSQKKANDIRLAIDQVQKQYDDYSKEFFINNIALDEIEAKINKLQLELNTCESEIENSDAILQDRIEEYLIEARKNSVEYFEQDIATATEMFDNFKPELEAHKKSFKENFNTIIEKIEAFQNSLNSD